MGLREKFGQRKNKLLCEASGGGNGESGRERRACMESSPNIIFAYAPEDKVKFPLVEKCEVNQYLCATASRSASVVTERK